MARQETADGTTLALNAIGLSILSSTGVTIGGPLPVEKKPINGFDIHEVSGDILRDIADPTVNPTVKLNAFIELKRNDSCTSNCCQTNHSSLALIPLEVFAPQLRAWIEEGNHCIAFVIGGIYLYCFGFIAKTARQPKVRFLIASA